MKAFCMDKARLYGEQFARALPLDGEVATLSRYLVSSRSVLDVGCGTGRLVIPLAESGLSVVGIDTNREYVRAAAEKLRLKQPTCTADLLVADARHMPLGNVCFDAIICMGNVLGDVGVRRHERTVIVQEMTSVFGSGAILIIELVHRYWKPIDLLVWGFRYLATSLKKLAGKPVEYGDYAETIGLGHNSERLVFHAFTNKEGEHLLAKNGFIVKVEKRARFFHDWFFVVATCKVEPGKVF